MDTHTEVKSIVTAACFGLLLASAGCASIVDDFSGRTEACRILATGEPGTGTIVRLIDTGATINNDPVVEFVVRVVPANGTPFEGRAKSLVSRLDVPAVQPGRVLPVKYDPRDPARVAFDLGSCPAK
ncbi:DUF3592 domain-containing protein [Usitatibacter palustris]|uniref:Uncharacterized protein n=1 Tax=Usitatibacter palustris TaxID=2732487 RepID=A0A6M4HAD3_9PROT|nr:DUF3592 domain-containing protein [Usitatibacter palustris]QJR16212.1 hypothetical protein DSM104440_03041 [Usitatibacter palustris]